MFKVPKDIHPQSFYSMFVYKTRHPELYCSPIVNTILMRNSLRCAGVIIWNKYIVLSDYNCTLYGFKSGMKQFLSLLIILR